MLARIIAFASAVALAGPALAQPAPARVDVVLADFSFTPSIINLAANRPVTLHLVNRGSGGHNFVARQFFAAAAIDPGSARKPVKGTIELKKGASADVTLTPRAGQYDVHCSHFLHSSFGMTGSIVVE
jgi:plastocyanin